MNLEQLVNSKLHILNETDLIVWRYICANKKDCCHISIYDIANFCNVSRTTVLRFAKKLGLDGFSDLKMMLKLEIGQIKENIQMNISDSTIKLCKYIGEEIAKQNFTRLNKLIYGADCIFIYASGHAQKNVASEIVRLFVNCNVFVYEIKGSDEFRRIVKFAKPNDVFIIISLSGESSEVVELAKQVHLYNIPIISLTRLKSNTLATLSKENIYVTPIELPAALDIEYKSMVGFFVAVEMWFVSYSQYVIEQENEK